MRHNSGLIILAGPGESTRIVYHALSRHFDIDAVVVENLAPAVPFLIRRIKKIGPARVFGQVLFRTLAEPFLRAAARQRIAEIKTTGLLDDSPIPGNKLVRIPSVNGDLAIQTLAMLSPRVIVVNGTRIISKRMLASCGAAFINMHAGITPGYRGVHGAYWALTENNRDACGVTVHLVDAGIDTGSILAQVNIAPTAQDNFVTYPLLQLSAGLPAMVEAVRDALDNKTKALQPPRMQSRLWSHPTIWQYLQLRWQSGIR
jgi:methionyl-tRNA formyltransferase